MSIIQLFTQHFMGKRDIINVNDEIVDGVITLSNPNKEQKEVIKEPESEPEEPEEWVLSKDYIESMVERGLSRRTAKEYYYDLGSFKTCLDTITVEQIEHRMKGLKEASIRRKLTALRSYAKWRLDNDNPSLFLTLAKLKSKNKKQVTK